MPSSSSPSLSLSLCIMVVSSLKWISWFVVCEFFQEKPTTARCSLPEAVVKISNRLSNNLFSASHFSPPVTIT